MARKKINADVKVSGRILSEFGGSHYLAGATDVKEALLLLDNLLHNLLLQQAEVLNPQLNGVNTVFQISEPFTYIRVVLNGLEQMEGPDADYIVTDATHIQFYRPLNLNESLKVYYVPA